MTFFSLKPQKIIAVAILDILLNDFQVSHCLHEILDQCGAFSKLLTCCESPMVQRELNQLESIAKVNIFTCTVNMVA